MAEMNEIAIKRGWTQKKWDAYKRWMYTKYGWRDWMVADTEATMNDYERVLARAEKYPPTIGADVLPGETAPAAPKAAAPPTATTVETTVSPLPYKWVIPGQVLLDPTTGKYYYTGGDYSVPTTGIEELYAEITPEQVEDFRKQYIEQTTPDTLAREQFEWQKAEAARKAPSISEQQWTISQNRREWAPGVNIEQDITTGKLYRPGSMVEVSPDIATAELQKAQTQRDWAGETFSLAKEKFAWERERAAKAEDPELQRQINELRWEKDRIQLLSGLPSDDWISRYTLQNQPNPYKRSEENVRADRMNQVTANLDIRTGEVQNLQNQLAAAVTAGNTETAAKLEAELKNTTASRDYLYNLYNTMTKEAENWTPQPVPQLYPNAPEWLPKYAPGQTAGRMITPQNVPTPSGQQLTQMSPSRAAQLGFFADWTKKMGGGRNWRDILGEAAIMQPLTPRGAGATRWSPARM